MSRVEENQEMLEKVPKGFNGAYERVNNAVLIAQLYILKDISKSLAVIADHYCVEKPGDAHKCCYWNDNINWCTLGHKVCPDNGTCEDFD